MTQHRSLLLHGLSLTLRRFPALLWAFAFNLLYSAVTTLRLSSAVGAATDTSLAAQPLHHGFDVGTLVSLGLKLREGPGLAPSTSVSVLLYLATYFLIVPGTLLCYQTGAPARLSTLLQAGLLHFWRFVRISLLTLLVMGPILGILVSLWAKICDRIDATHVGRGAFLVELSGYLAILLIAAVLRLYFDLVEVYTVQLGLHLRPSGKPDRRVRRTLLPAFRALRLHFARACETFVLLGILGLAATALSGRFILHSLAQPRVWPMFLVAQAGLFLMLLTRFWQRGAETTLSLNHPILEAPIVRTTFAPREPVPPPPVFVPGSIEGEHPAFLDPIPPPEPPSPSLAEPDPAVYHHEVGQHDLPPAHSGTEDPERLL
jgi:hypothetical protein